MFYSNVKGNLFLIDLNFFGDIAGIYSGFLVSIEYAFDKFKN